MKILNLNDVDIVKRKFHKGGYPIAGMFNFYKYISPNCYCPLYNASGFLELFGPIQEALREVKRR